MKNFTSPKIVLYWKKKIFFCSKSSETSKKIYFRGCTKIEEGGGPVRRIGPRTQNFFVPKKKFFFAPNHLKHRKNRFQGGVQTWGGGGLWGGKVKIAEPLMRNHILNYRVEIIGPSYRAHSATVTHSFYRYTVVLSILTVSKPFQPRWPAKWKNSSSPHPQHHQRKWPN